ncbi:MAG: hypothetical protein ABIJ56_14340 [Pseudomonadota bacterium]
MRLRAHAAGLLVTVLFLAAPAAAAKGEKEPAGGAEKPGSRLGRYTAVTTEPPNGMFGALRLGFGLYMPSLQLQAQAGWAFGKGVSLGAVIEFNPYINYSKNDVSAGAYDFGIFLGYCWRLTDRIGLNFELLGGGTVLLFNTYGYRKGDMGFWIGVKLMGLHLAVHKHLDVTVDLVDLACPVFHITTMPFLYPQWRMSVGIAFR